jgi:haloalkane dehalogenase
VEWVRSLAIDALGLDALTVVGQDWGGLIGLRIAAEHPDRVARIVAANTGLPTGDHDMPEIWWQFRLAMETAQILDIGRFVQAGCRQPMSAETRAAYDAPFPDETFKAAPRAMPGLVPTTPEDPSAAANRRAWQALAAWHKPFLVAFSDSDPITGPMAEVFRAQVPGAHDRAHPVLEGAGHFLQEDAGERLGTEIAAFVSES